MDRIIIIIITAGTKLFSNDLQFTANFERSGNSFEINRPSQRERKKIFGRSISSSFGWRRRGDRKVGQLIGAFTDKTGRIEDQGGGEEGSVQ